MFSSILVRRRPLLRIGKLEFLHVYDILCAKDFNPNERTGFVFSKGNLKVVLKEQLHRAVLSFYSHQLKQIDVPVVKPKKEVPKAKKKEYVHQCKHCLSVYDPLVGEAENNIPAGTSFEQLPSTYSCSLCEASKEEFSKIEKSKLELIALDAI